MSGAYENQFDENSPLIRQLSKGQRRVLGVLVEKGLTTPDQYPLTLKAVTTGANQKSNRDPVTNYTEASVWDFLDELRELGLIAVVHPESGRTERFRHYMRRRFPFSEPQLAAITELLLRGRQQIGELRARASRLVPVESLDELRRELTVLQEMGFIQSTGPLERRGIQVDHNMYLDNEGAKLEKQHVADDSPVSVAPNQRSMTERAPTANTISESEIEFLRTETATLKTELTLLRETVEVLKDQLDELRRNLGV